MSTSCKANRIVMPYSIVIPELNAFVNLFSSFVGFTKSRGRQNERKHIFSFGSFSSALMAWFIFNTFLVGCGRSDVPGTENGPQLLANRPPAEKPQTVTEIPPKIRWTFPSNIQQKLNNLLWPERGETISGVIHALRLFSTDEAPPSGRPGVVEMRSLFLDDSACGSWYPGKHAVIPTRHGARFVDISATTNNKGGEAQAHRDQCLAVLAELGIPLSARIATPNKAIPVKDVLADALANFDPDQELEWTAAAFVLYLPPANAWTDKFGRKFDFDSLAMKLMARPFYRTSCYGSHTLNTLALLSRVDQKHRLLSYDVRTKVATLLHASAKFLENQQDASGSFPTNWYFPLLREAWYRELIGPGDHEKIAKKLNEWRWTQDGKTSIANAPIHVTGHHLEWMLLLPSEQRCSNSVFERGANYLLGRLSQIGESDAKISYCPVTHAVRVLRHLDCQQSDAVP